jgi:hypothetical protein
VVGTSSNRTDSPELYIAFVQPKSPRTWKRYSWTKTSEKGQYRVPIHVPHVRTEQTDIKSGDNHEEKDLKTGIEASL